MTVLKRPRDRTWKALTKWLRSKGEADAKPVHALRKSIGSLMANKFGIHAAQRLKLTNVKAWTEKAALAMLGACR